MRRAVGIDMSVLSRRRSHVTEVVLQCILLLSRALPRRKGCHAWGEGGQGGG